MIYQKLTKSARHKDCQTQILLASQIWDISVHSFSQVTECSLKIMSTSKTLSIELSTLVCDVIKYVFCSSNNVYTELNALDILDLDSAICLFPSNNLYTLILRIQTLSQHDFTHSNIDFTRSNNGWMCLCIKQFLFPKHYKCRAKISPMLLLT